MVFFTKKPNTSKKIVYKIEKIDKSFVNGKSVLYVDDSNEAYREAQYFPNIKTVITPIFPKKKQ